LTDTSGRLLHTITRDEILRRSAKQKPRKAPREESGKHCDHVFTHRRRPLASANTKAWKNALRWAGIENFRWHDLRHVWATWHVIAGTTLGQLQELGAW
jgi:integrase